MKLLSNNICTLLVIVKSEEVIIGERKRNDFRINLSSTPTPLNKTFLKSTAKQVSEFNTLADPEGLIWLQPPPPFKF